MALTSACLASEGLFATDTDVHGFAAMKFAPFDTQSATTTKGSDSPCSSEQPSWDSDTASVYSAQNVSSSGSGAPCLQGRVWALSQDTAGCREVQRAVEEAGSESRRMGIVEELVGHVAKAMRCPNANHVLQKIIVVSCPEASQFMIEELMARPGLLGQAARHRYGCRVVQHLLKRCRPWQLSELVESVIADAVALACHPFGSYSVQHVLQFGTEDQQYRLVRVLERNVATMVGSPAGCGAVAAAMSHCDRDDRVWLARAVLQQPGLLQTLAQARHGASAAAQIVRAVSDQEREQALAQVLEAQAALLACRYGRAFLQELGLRQ